MEFNESPPIGSAYYFLEFVPSIQNLIDFINFAVLGLLFQNNYILLT